MRENTPGPGCDAINLPHVSKPIQQQVNCLLHFVKIKMCLCNSSDCGVLLHHAEDEKDTKEILRPSEEIGYQALPISGRVHRNGPEKTCHQTLAGVVIVLVGHVCWEMKSLENKWSQDHKARVVVARA